MTENPYLAKAIIENLTPVYRSKVEEKWAQVGEIVVMHDLLSPVIRTYHEPLRFHVPGGWYKPDFLHILQDARIIIMEVKGMRKLPSHRDSRAKFRGVAEIYPFLIFGFAKLTKGDGWDIEWRNHTEPPQNIGQKR